MTTKIDSKPHSRLFACLALAVTLATPAICAAQDDAATPATTGGQGTNELDAKGVGISGGVIVGAELILATEAIIGVKPLWPYLVFPLLGAAGGGVGGYYLEQASPGGAVAMLVGGMALIIPTLLGVSAARAFDPEEEGAAPDEFEDGNRYSFENAPEKDASDEGTTTEVETRPEGGPPESLPGPGEETPPAEPAPAEEAPPEAPAGSLLNISSDGTPKLGVPWVGIRPLTLSGNDGRAPHTGIEVYVPLVHITLP